MTIPSRKRLAQIATVTLTMEPNPESFVGQCSAIDPVMDKAQEAFIRKELADGNDWAWCNVIVTAEWGGLSVRDSLCGCSYQSESDFRKDDYFTDMVSSALDALHENLTETARQLRAEERRERSLSRGAK